MPSTAGVIQGRHAKAFATRARTAWRVVTRSRASAARFARKRSGGADAPTAIASFLADRGALGVGQERAFPIGRLDRAHGRDGARRLFVHGSGHVAGSPSRVALEDQRNSGKADRRAKARQGERPSCPIAVNPATHN
jgi:hypothetical protein